MQRLMFVSELDALHMPSSLSAFQSCSKERLVKSLWKNHAQEPRVSRTEILQSCTAIGNLQDTGAEGSLLYQQLPLVTNSQARGSRGHQSECMFICYLCSYQMS